MKFVEYFSALLRCTGHVHVTRKIWRLPMWLIFVIFKNDVEYATNDWLKDSALWQVVDLGPSRHVKAISQWI